MTIPECFYRISVKALILDEQKRFLLVQEDNGRWELPGGGLDHGETPKQGLAREIMEEMGLSVTSVGAHPEYFVTRRTTNGNWSCNILYRATVEHLRFTPSSECVALDFFTVAEAQQLDVFQNVAQFLEQYDPTRH